MSMHEDTLLAARFAALAPEPLAGNWDEVLDKAGTAPKGRLRPERSRLLQGRRRRLFVAVAAVALVALMTASALAVRALITEKDFSGLPPSGATPSTPQNGVLEMYYWVHDVRGRTRSWVYADGRLIRLGVTGDRGPLRGLREQRLTREGIELLRSEIISAGGFGQAPPPSDSEPLNRFDPPTIQVRQGDRLVPLRWASDLKRLEARLTDPESWLPASAWKQRKKAAYVPARFKVCAAVIEKVTPGFKFQPMRAARIVTLLPAAAQNVLRGRDWNAEDGSGCFAVRTEEARKLAKALEGAGPAKKGRLNYRFNAPGLSRQVVIGFNPYFPHGKTECLECG
jgi:hypothetical protein